MVSSCKTANLRTRFQVLDITRQCQPFNLLTAQVKLNRQTIGTTLRQKMSNQRRDIRFVLAMVAICGTTFSR